MSSRHFLFLQGPHGPFFTQLASRLRATGHHTWRVGFNGGDRIFWPGSDYIPHRDSSASWGTHLDLILSTHRITDLVLYGDARPHHAEALRKARAAGLRTHIFEEGYLRPYWITYERHGSNANSRLVHTSAHDTSHIAQPLSPPDRWGDTRQHIFYGACYHLCVALSSGYPEFRSHRNISVWTEAALNIRRLVMLPLTRSRRTIDTHRVRRLQRPFHVVLLQLAHDANFRAHSSFSSQHHLIDHIAAGFAKSAPKQHVLVFKCHPFEDGRENLRRAVTRAKHRYALHGRVYLITGGKLAPLLDEALTAVTVNSTAGHQALWRGMPLCALGQAVYKRPGLASSQPIDAFFADPQPPDPETYNAFRTLMLQTSQMQGSFYSAEGRNRLLGHIIKIMIRDRDPYNLFHEEYTESGPPQFAEITVD